MHTSGISHNSGVHAAPMRAALPAKGPTGTFRGWTITIKAALGHEGAKLDKQLNRMARLAAHAHDRRGIGTVSTKLEQLHRKIATSAKVNEKLLRRSARCLGLMGQVSCQAGTLKNETAANLASWENRTRVIGVAGGVVMKRPATETATTKLAKQIMRQALLQESALHRQVSGAAEVGLARHEALKGKLLAKYA